MGCQFSFMLCHPIYASDLLLIFSAFNFYSSFGKIDDITLISPNMTLKNQETKKKSIFQKIFLTKDRNGPNEKKMDKETFNIPEAPSDSALESLFFSSVQMPSHSVQSFRVFVATWNVGGKPPHSGLNLDDFLQVNNQSDIYVLGFQEIVPLNAGNVLVIEDNEPAAKWLTLINQSLNKSHSLSSRGLKSTPSFSSSLFFPKPSLKKVSKTFRTESKRRLKTCNCMPELEKKNSKEFCFRCQQSNISEDDNSSEEDDDVPSNFELAEISIRTSQMKYSLVASKQMVGIFVTVWMRKELVPYVGHLRISCISRGIMGCLGNKGCISVSMSFYQTNFCFICSHLASGEKEGDELRRNLDVIEILRNTQFPKICRTPSSRVPEKILDHDRVIWFGDLNYRIALSYSDTRKLLEQNNWDTLLDKDQLKIEKDAGRVFKGWKEGKIYFAPTYKYSYNSDMYAGETIKTKNKRRTPAWCDRILWHGNGIRQLSYIRGESRFSDHRPVCGTFLVDVEVAEGGLRKKLSGSNMKVGVEELLPSTRK
ncbi:type I inositol polyphosphate 5-phosphatase 10-like isoform X1 [Pistacia vera]|uniref:type I inositol polyphosphate 5-phosphatase 10-like isoform X1 n=3 Tax=Pistacia vera TaxID=55513 RepID=UPI0012630B7F|nr:type I inositol polyphosphate 5-phosphatase 10-like isoform X1 [Pistacia vera]